LVAFALTLAIQGGSIMAKPLLTDELWKVIEPLLPPIEVSPLGGRPPVGNRQTLTGILFILKTGMSWEDLPRELGCGCGRTCFRRLVAWHEAGVWKQLHEVLLAKLQAADRLDWSRAIVDSASIKAVLGGQNPARTRRIAASAAASIMC
jgi:transposase